MTPRPRISTGQLQTFVDQLQAELATTVSENNDQEGCLRLRADSMEQLVRELSEGAAEHEARTAATEARCQ
jgi:hypothetical protein